MTNDPTHEAIRSLGWRLAALLGIVIAMGAMLSRDRVQFDAPDGLLVPVVGVATRDLVDSFEDPRGWDRVHEAIDIPAPRGTPVVAAAAGPVQSIFTSSRGGLTVYQLDRTGTHCFYYAHLDGYADGLAVGQQLNPGEPIGYVGTSGNAPDDVPHLHFAVLRLDETTGCHEAPAINPIHLFR